MLTLLWKEVGVGTPVYIYESIPREASGSSGKNDLDLTKFR